MCISENLNTYDNDYDILVIGAGIGGLSAAAILSSVYKLKVGVFESHYRIGGCAHSFPYKSKTSGSTYMFGIIIIIIIITIITIITSYYY